MKRHNLLKRILAVFLSVLMLMGSGISLIATAAGSTAISYEQAIQWLKDQNGKYYDLDGNYGYQCSDFATAYIRMLVKGSTADTGPLGNYSWARVHNAKDYIYINNWPEGWQVLPRSSTTPIAGDLFVSTSGGHGYGHIGAIIQTNIGGNANIVKVADQNAQTDIYGDGRGPVWVHDVAWNSEAGIKVYTAEYIIRPPLHTHVFDYKDKAATCTEAGYHNGTCSCGATDNHVLDPLGHQQQHTDVPATCLERGYSDYTCARCGVYLGRNLGGGAQDKAPLGHHMVAGTPVPPTCTEEGYTVYTCDRINARTGQPCGHQETRDYTPALGHLWEGNPTANCLEVTDTVYKCIRENSRTHTVVIDGATITKVKGEPCGETKTSKWTDWYTAQQAQYETGGYAKDTKLQYHIYTTDSVAGKSGWNYYGSTWVWNNGAPSGWSTAAPGGSTDVNSDSTRIYETKTVDDTHTETRYKTQWHYYRWTDGSKWGGSSKEYAEGTLGLRNTYLEEAYFDSDLPINNTLAYGGNYWDPITENLWIAANYVYNRETSISHDYTVQTPYTVEVPGSHTEYRYYDRTKVYTYYFWQWADAQNGSSKASVDGDSDSGPHTRTLYRYSMEPMGHDMNTDWYVSVEPTCLTPGEERHDCARGDGTLENGGIEARPLDPLGHDMGGEGNWVTIQEPTCTEPGVQKRVCIRDPHGCTPTEENGGVEYRAIAPLGHQYTSEIIQPTCFRDGWIEYTCSVCGDKQGGLPLDNRHLESEKIKNLTDENVRNFDLDYYNDNFVKITGTTTDYDGITHNTYAHNDAAIRTAELPEELITHGHNYVLAAHVEPTYDAEGYDYWECTDDDGHAYHDPAHNYCDNFKAPLPKPQYKAVFVLDWEGGAQYGEPVYFYAGDEALNEPSCPQVAGWDTGWENWRETYAVLPAHDIVIPSWHKVMDSGDPSDYTNTKTSEAFYNDALIKLEVSAPTKTVKVFTEDAEPLDIVLVVDQSLSMNYAMDKNSNPVGAEYSRLKALKETAQSFVNSVYDNAVKTGADHRIAVVGFSANSSYSYQGTGILTTPSGGTIGYANASANGGAAYKNALLPVSSGSALNSRITSAINGISAAHATAADLGLELAGNIFANHTDEAEGRKRLVLFLTDGEPTADGNGFSDMYGSGYTGAYQPNNIANRAIAQADALKNTYGATIYSVGMRSDANPQLDVTGSFDLKQTAGMQKAFNRFLQYVSSNNEQSGLTMLSAVQSVDRGYYLSPAVNPETKLYDGKVDLSRFKYVFDNMFLREVQQTLPFEHVTITDTITKDFTLTQIQEMDLRNYLWDFYKTPSEDIIITRNDDGTTTVTIKDMQVRYDEERACYYARVELWVTANENCTDADYVTNTNTEEAGFNLPGGPETGYIDVFAPPPDITFPENRSIAVFRVKGAVYAIQSGKAGDRIVHPVTAARVWNVSDFDVLLDEPVYYDTELATPTSTITWHIGDETKTDEYKQGDIVVYPADPVRAGYEFLGWSQRLPYVMPGYNLDVTALFAAHEHNFEFVGTFGTCETGTRTYYRCRCGEEKTITTAAGEHLYKATFLPSANQTTHVQLVCELCGKALEQDLSYTLKQSPGQYAGKPVYTVTLDGAALGKAAIITIPLPLSVNLNNLCIYADDGTKMTPIKYTIDEANKTITFEISGSGKIIISENVTLPNDIDLNRQENSDVFKTLSDTYKAATGNPLRYVTNGIIDIDENGKIHYRFAKIGTALVSVYDAVTGQLIDTFTVEVKWTWWQWILVVLAFGWLYL